MQSLIPAATVILSRDRAGSTAGFELLMLRRDSKLAFAGGMWVFPGGRVDPEDYADDPEDLAVAEARAAAREAAEESGLSVPAEGMRRWSHWTPPDMGQSHRFSTAFFVAAAPEGEVAIDDGEIREFIWGSPGQTLELHQDGQIELAPPTFITLCQLDAASSTGELLGLAERRTPERFETRIVMADEHPVALYHGDIAYEAPERVAEDGPRHRLHMVPSRWHYERTT